VEGTAFFYLPFTLRIGHKWVPVNKTPMPNKIVSQGALTLIPPPPPTPSPPPSPPLPPPPPPFFFSPSWEFLQECEFLGARLPFLPFGPSLPLRPHFSISFVSHPFPDILLQVGVSTMFSQSWSSRQLTCSAHSLPRQGCSSNPLPPFFSPSFAWPVRSLALGHHFFPTVLNIKEVCVIVSGKSSYVPSADQAPCFLSNDSPVTSVALDGVPIP